MNLTRGINLRLIAEMMPGASGAEVKVRDGYHLLDRICRIEPLVKAQSGSKQAL